MDAFNSGFGSNPWGSAMGDDIQRRTQQMLDQSLSGIRGNFVGTGGLGGSRQGIAQGQAIQGAADSLQGNLGNLYGGMWNNDQNRQLSQYGMDQNFYTQQRGQDQSQVGL